MRRSQSGAAVSDFLAAVPWKVCNYLINGRSLSHSANIHLWSFKHHRCNLHVRVARVPLTTLLSTICLIDIDDELQTHLQLTPL